MLSLLSMVTCSIESSCEGSICSFINGKENLATKLVQQETLKS